MAESLRADRTSGVSRYKQEAALDERWSLVTKKGCVGRQIWIARCNEKDPAMQIDNGRYIARYYIRRRKRNKYLFCERNVTARAKEFLGGLLSVLSVIVEVRHAERSGRR